MSVFERPYATAYDALYGDKDYGAECDMLEEVFRRFAESPIRAVLDLGCGTGNHAIRLAERGYTVTGVDMSTSMLAEAEGKARARNLPMVLHHGDIRALELGQEFDAVLMMFAVLGYQVEDTDVLGALATARRHLRPRGLLVFDCWYGPAVLTQRPGDRVKTVPTREGAIIRTASAALDTERHLCEVCYQLRELKRDRVVAETREEHRMRFFFTDELELFLRRAGLRLLRTGAFPSFDLPASESSWNTLVIATTDAPPPRTQMR